MLVAALLQSMAKGYRLNSFKVLTFALLLTTALSAQAGVPALLNFQGKLADSAGLELADGTYTVVFTIFADSVGGNSLWSESAQVQTFSGLFSYQLGSVAPLPADLFAENAQLFLQVNANGVDLWPRSQLTSVPYATVAGDLSVSSDNDTTVIATDATTRTITFYDTSGDLRALLGAGNDGGRLILTDTDDEIKVGLYAGLHGDQAAVLPDSSVSAAEIFNEPGLVVRTNTRPVTLVTGVMTDLVEARIETPEDGYLIVEGKCYVEFSGTTSANMALIQVDEFEGGSSQFPYYALAGLGGYASDDASFFPVYVTRVYYKDAGIHTFRMEGRAEQPPPANVRSWDHVLTLRYFPTYYGVVSGAVEDPSGYEEAVQVTSPDPLDPEKTRTIYEVDLRSLRSPSTQPETSPN